MENLEELVRVAREYDATAPEGGSLGEFLQQIALLADADTIRDDEGLVTLMTLHNAKGLEFPIVFIIGLEDGVFPHSRAIEEGNVEEERRLAYVGLTRAMRDLTLTLRPPAQLVRRPVARRPLALPRRDPARADRPAGRAPPPASRRRAASPPGRAPPPPRRRLGRAAAARSSAWATTSSTPRSARAWSRPPSRAGIVVVRFAGDGPRAQADGRLRAAQEARVQPRIRTRSAGG